MASLADELERKALDLGWSLWAELGVGSARRRHDHQALDLEPLILYTAAISATGPLRTAALEWCRRSSRFTSAFRLRHFAERGGAKMIEAFERFAAQIGAPWSDARESLAVLAAERAGPGPDLRRPSLVQLRLRALVGVSARAEVLKAMLADPARAQTASALAELAGYGKGSVAQALEMLTLAGLVDVHPAANRLLYRLSTPAELAATLRWLPASHPDWWAVFRVIIAMVESAKSATAVPAAQQAAVDATIASVDRELRRLGVDAELRGRISRADLERWAIRFIEQQDRAAPAHAVTYAVHHEPSGTWKVSVLSDGKETRTLAPAGENGDGHEDRRVPAGPGTIAPAMFEDALGAPTSRLGPHRAVDAVIHAFADEVLRAVRAGQQATFSAEFIRRWFDNRRRRLDPSA